MITETQKPLFDEVCRAAQSIMPKRMTASKATDWTGYIYRNIWSDSDMRYIVLYEAEKRIVKGHTQPEVCWAVIAESGQLFSVPARHLRRMEEKSGFAFWKRPSLLDL